MTPRSTANVVLGTWGLAGAGALSANEAYGEVDAEVAARTFDRAWQLGIRLVDTAPGYGGGEGLRRLADWHRRRPHRFSIAAKPGRYRTDAGMVSDIRLKTLLAEVTAGETQVGSPAYVLVKDPPASTYHDGSLMRVLRALAMRLPAATVGVASHLPTDLAGLPPPGGRWIAQIELNALNRTVSVPAADALAAAGWEVWAMQPLAYGYLARAHLQVHPRRDWRALIPPQVCSGLRLGAAAFAARLSLTDTASRAAAAIAFCLSVRSVSRVVVGPKHPGQLDAVVRALEMVADPRRLADLRALSADCHFTPARRETP